MLAEQRYKEILCLLDKEESVKTTTLCKVLCTSRETVRRDLENMEAKGLLKRIHGGAMRLENSQKKNNYYASFDQRKLENSSYKEEVAMEAVKYISEGQAIALDSGTTALELARVIKNRFHSLTVVTNSLSIANELADADGITLVLTGGIYSSDERAFTSDLATLIFSKINIDILFLTTCGISVERGITYQRIDEIVVQNQMMKVSDKTIVIADSSKLGVNSLVRMCGIERASMIITDSGATKEQIEALEQGGIEVVISKEREKNSNEYENG